MTDARFEFGDRAVYLPGADAVVLSDLHVGRDRTSSVELPLGERADLTERLETVLGAFDPGEVVIGGDLLHAFESVPAGTEETLSVLLEAIEDAGAEPVVVRGNHDPMLDAVYGGSIHEEYALADGETVVCHGHEAPETEAARYVAGHDHPAIEIEGRRHPCFLLGREVYRGADVLLLPAFSSLAAGTPVNGASGADLLSPLATELNRFRPIVRDATADETLRFPPLGKFRRLL